MGVPLPCETDNGRSFLQRPEKSMKWVNKRVRMSLAIDGAGGRSRGRDVLGGWLYWICTIPLSITKWNIFHGGLYITRCNKVSRIPAYHGHCKRTDDGTKRDETRVRCWDWFQEDHELQVIVGRWLQVQCKQEFLEFHDRNSLILQVPRKYCFTRLLYLTKVSIGVEKEKTCIHTPIEIMMSMLSCVLDSKEIFYLFLDLITVSLLSLERGRSGERRSRDWVNSTLLLVSACHGPWSTKSQTSWQPICHAFFTEPKKCLPIPWIEKIFFAIENRLL